MKKVFLLSLVLMGCSDATLSGVSQDFIRQKFKLSSSADTVIIDVTNNDNCPQVEFSASNNKTFQIRRTPGDPLESQTTFKYSEDEYSEDGDQRTLKGNNSTNTEYEITLLNKIYTIRIDYACTNANDTDCVKTNYTCSGPLL